jgi:DNA polymerase-4
MTKILVHIDMDAYFVSIEERDNPSLKGKPVAVGGAPNTRSVLATCNYEARKYGCRSAMSSAQAVVLCPELILLKGRMSVYQETSVQIFSVLHEFSDIVEVVSVDEAYLDITDRCDGDPQAYVKQIRKAIFAKVNLTASAGIAPKRFLAKIASDMEKPNGQYTIEPEDMALFIEYLPLEKISGVGKVMTQKLAARGWTVGGDIRDESMESVQSALGKMGAALWRKCQGIDNDVLTLDTVRKSVGVEFTFDVDKRGYEPLNDYLHQIVLPELMKRFEEYRGKRQIKKLGIKLKFDDFIQTSKECKSTQVDGEIFSALLDTLYRQHGTRRVRLIGAVIGFDDGEYCYEQLRLI